MDAPPYSAAAVDVLRLPAGTTEPDRVAVEEPLEIRIAGRPVAVTMRTPGHDEELALGFCLSEGLRPRAARLPDDLAANTVEVDAPGFDPARLQRSFFTSSSCGVCGKGALEAVEVEAPRVESKLRVPLALVASLPDRLREAQAAFAVDRRPARDRALLRRRRAAVRPRGRRPAQRAGQGRRLGLPGAAAAARRARPLRERAALVRARPEGGGRRLSRPRRASARRRASPSSSRPTAASRSAASSAAARRTSTPSRGGSRADRHPARRRREHALRLAEGARAVRGRDARASARGVCSGRSCDERIAVGSARGLPFAGARRGTTPTRRSPAIAAGLRAATHELAVVVPVDMPLLTAGALRRLADALPRRGGRRRRARYRARTRRRRCPLFETRRERRLRSRRSTGSTPLSSSSTRGCSRT